MAKTPAPAAPSNQGSPEAMAARKATRSANAALDIDYGTAREEGSFSASGRTSFWVQKLNKLAQDCASDESGAEFGKFYLIGTFSTASTAQSTRKRIEDEHVGELVGTFALKSERTKDGSALYAAAYADENEAGADPKNKPVAGNDDDDFTTD